MLNTTSGTGLFLAEYEISTGLAGAPVLHLALTVNTVDRAVSGAARVTQAINPPLDVRSQVHGSFTYMTVMPNQTSILVVATGTPSITWPHGGGVGPVLLPNLHLRMVLDKSWEHGVANFSYIAPSGQWVEIENAKVAQGARQPPVVMLYAAALQEATASGDLARMKQIAAQAEAQLANNAEIASALAAIKAEIAAAKKKG